MLHHWVNCSPFFTPTSCQHFCGLSKRPIELQQQLSGKRPNHFSLSFSFFLSFLSQMLLSHCAPTLVQRWQSGHSSVYLSNGGWVTLNLAESRANAGALLRPLNHFSAFFFFFNFSQTPSARLFCSWLWGKCWAEKQQHLQIKQTSREPLYDEQPRPRPGGAAAWWCNCIDTLFSPVQNKSTQMRL